MRKNVKNKEMNNTQLFFLSVQTCQWWNATIVQANRFFAMLKDSHGSTPWDQGDANSMFVADRMFLITSIYHAIENLEKLDYELQRIGDSSMRGVLDAIDAVAPLEDIKNLRNMNEHILDYLMDEGHKQNQFKTTVNKNGYTILTTAAWTYEHIDADVTLIGNIDINRLIQCITNQLSLVRKKTKEVFENALTC